MPFWQMYMTSRLIMFLLIIEVALVVSFSEVIKLMMHGNYGLQIR